jgi:dTDP-4-amino-4,6-dideoxygalactose transaminase
MSAEIPGGINSRLDEIQACFLRAFLPHLGDWNTSRRRLSALYDEALKDVPGIRPLRVHAASVRHLYVVRAERRDALREFLTGLGIGTGIHYSVPLHLQPAFQDAGFHPGDLPHAERACQEILSLPLWPYLSLEQAAEVVEAVREFYRR